MTKWVSKVKEVYVSLSELKQYDEIYGVVGRCGYKTAEKLWEENPFISGSVNPRDFGLASLKEIKNHQQNK